jgi:chemotaxis receptor (MCP) glutamine deamidase CheD
MFYDKTLLCGGMAHVMLPGVASKSEGAERYAVNAISDLLKQMNNLGANLENIECCLIGGANVLRKPDDSLVKSIINSVLEEVDNLEIPVRKSSLGGSLRQIANLQIETGTVSYSQGDGKLEVFYNFLENN